MDTSANVSGSSSIINQSQDSTTEDIESVQDVSEPVL